MSIYYAGLDKKDGALDKNDMMYEIYTRKSTNHQQTPVFKC